MKDKASDKASLVIKYFFIFQLPREKYFDCTLCCCLTSSAVGSCFNSIISDGATMFPSASRQAPLPFDAIRDFDSSFDAADFFLRHDFLFFGALLFVSSTALDRALYTWCIIEQRVLHHRTEGFTS